MSYVGRRVAWCFVVLWAVISIAFALNELLPGDPARIVAGVQARPSDVARVRQQLGLDRPPIVRCARFWSRFLHLGPPANRLPIDSHHATCAVVLPLGPRALHIDFGRSFQRGQPVIAVLPERALRTLSLAVAAVVIQVVLGVSIGTVAALRRGSRSDRLLVGATLLGASVPTYLIALALQLVFARGLRWLPLDGFGTNFAEHARSLVLPALTLGVCGTAFYARLVRDEMASTLARDWVRTAHAKGLPRWRVVLFHALRIAMVPVGTAIALDLGALMGGAIVTETVFRWPGLGELSVHATLDKDGPVLSACVVVASLAVVATNLAVDLAYGWIDPRISDPRARDNR